MHQDVLTFVTTLVANTTVTAVVTEIPSALMVTMVTLVTLPLIF
jgi:hypothetical protein